MRKNRNRQNAEDLIMLVVICALIGIGIYLAPFVLLAIAILFIWSACKAGSDDDDQNNRD